MVEYNKAIEKDLLNIANNSKRISREIEENMKYLKEIEKVKSFILNAEGNWGNFKGKNKLTNFINFALDPNKEKLIKNFIVAGQFFKKYKKMKEDYEKKIITFKSVFEAEVLNTKPKLSVEYEQYIDEIYKRVKVVNIFNFIGSANCKDTFWSIRRNYYGGKETFSWWPNKKNASGTKNQVTMELIASNDWIEFHDGVQDSSLNMR